MPVIDLIQPEPAGGTRVVRIQPALLTTLHSSRSQHGRTPHPPQSHAMTRACVCCRSDEGDAVIEEDVTQDDDAADITSQVGLHSLGSRAGLCHHTMCALRQGL